MLLRSLLEMQFSNVFVEIQGVLPHAPVNLKMEGLNAGGSIKMKPAMYMVETLERRGILKPGSRLVESSSGNLGLALAVVCAVKGYAFTCVSDPNLSPQTARLIRSYGADVVLVEKRDANGGYLASRIELIRSWLALDPDLVWVNQYANVDNVRAHERSTGPEILAQFSAPDFVFIGAGTTGTLGGVSRHLRRRSPRTRIIAVDSVGSVTFGAPPGKRYIPGLGTSRRPEIARLSEFCAVEFVPEQEAIGMCRKLSRRGLLLGGSTGTVLAAVARWSDRLSSADCIVAISPDFGDRYVDTVYDDAWVKERFPRLLPVMDDGGSTTAPAIRPNVAVEDSHV
jgi:N-(2-amino-2-carboxyethyl)-L-glutamate synthase